MNIQLTSDNVEISPSMKALAEQKIKKLEVALENIPEGQKSLRVVMNSTKDDQFLAKIHAVVHGKEYFSEETGYTLENALVSAVETLKRELEKDKVMSTEKSWDQAREAKHFDPVESLEVDINQD